MRADTCSASGTARVPPGRPAARLRATARGVLTGSHPDERVHDRPIRPGSEELQDLLGWLALGPLGLELRIGATALQPRRCLRGPLGPGRVPVDLAAPGEHDPVDYADEVCRHHILAQVSSR